MDQRAQLQKLPKPKNLAVLKAGVQRRDTIDLLDILKNTGFPAEFVSWPPARNVPQAVLYRRLTLCRDRVAVGCSPLSA